MKTIKGDLILEKDTVFNESITVEGDIKGKDGKRFNLTVQGNIHAEDINAGDINAGDINANDIDARNINANDIDARNINAGDINARDIICVSRKKKKADSKTIAYSIVLDRFNRERKEVM